VRRHGKRDPPWRAPVFDKVPAETEDNLLEISQVLLHPLIDSEHGHVVNDINNVKRNGNYKSQESFYGKCKNKFRFLFKHITVIAGFTSIDLLSPSLVNLVTEDSCHLPPLDSNLVSCQRLDPPTICCYRGDYRI
jgi:hypothetical protein